MSLHVGTTLNRPPDQVLLESRLIGGILELFYIDDAGHACQISSGGVVNGGGGGSTVEKFTAENKDVATIKAGQPVAIHSSGTGVVRANATTSGKECVGLAMADIAVAVSGDIQTDGQLTLADWTDATGAATLAARATYYLDTTAGKLATASPGTVGNISQSCGSEVTTTTLDIRLRYPILL